MEDLFHDNKSMLKSMLLDEEKLITYVSLSKELCIHVNSSKSLLKYIVESIREENPTYQLNVIYVLSGSIDNNHARTIVCSEQDLSKERKCFKNIFFEHIYSVSKGCCSIDTAAYLTVNKFEDFVLCPGLIKSNQCEKRTLFEINDLKLNSQEIVMPEKSKSLPTKKIKQETSVYEKSNSEIKIISKDNESKSEPTIKQEPHSPNKAAIGSNKPKLSSSNGHSTQTGIAGFLKKTNSNSNKEAKEILKNGKDTQVKSDKPDVKVEKMDVEEITPKAVIKDVGKNKNSINTKLNQLKKTSKVDKKRKRVLHVSDSESDSENNDPFVDESATEREQATAHESEDEIPPTPTINKIVIKSGIVNPKKRRKVIDKTYTDEDGYILTKKEEVYESCSENEDDVKVQEKPQANVVKPQLISPKEKPIGPKKKVSPPQKGKQPTLTNFFKRV